MNSDPVSQACCSTIGLLNASDTQRFKDEILRMREFDHPRVMSLLGVCLDAGPEVAIIMPYMEKGSLQQMLEAARNQLIVSDEESSSAVC